MNSSLNSALPQSSTSIPPAASPLSPKSPPYGKKKLPLQYVFGGLALLLLVIGGGVAYYLSQQNQELRQQASTGYNCPVGFTETSGGCVETSTLSGNNTPNPSSIAAGQGANHSCDAGYSYVEFYQSCIRDVTPDDSALQTSCATGYTMTSMGCVLTDKLSGSYIPTVKDVNNNATVNPATGGVAPIPTVIQNTQDQLNAQIKGSCTAELVARCYYLSNNGACIPSTGLCSGDSLGGAAYNVNGCADSRATRGTGDFANKCYCNDANQSYVGIGEKCATTSSTAITCTGATPVKCPSTNTCVSDASKCTAGACVSGGGACDSGSCCAGYVCQGLSGSRKCQKQFDNICPGVTDAANACGGVGGGVLGFKCTHLTNGQCLENPATFDSFAAAAAYAGTCGQVDEVCKGGSNNRNLCGGFSITNEGCTGGPPANPPSTPPSNPPTTPTPTPGPVCLNVTISKANPQVGESVTFTCGTVAGANHYQFRIKLPDGTVKDLAATNNVSASFTIAAPGAHKAQCRICTGADDSTCQAYGTL